MLALPIDALVAWLLVKRTAPGWKRMLLGVLGGWLAAVIGFSVTGLLLEWPAVDVLSRMTVGLLVHPLVVVGFVWVFEKIRYGGKGRGSVR